MASEVHKPDRAIQLGRSIGNVVGTIGFYSQVVKDVLLDPYKSPLFLVNPFGINMAQAKERHSNLPDQNLRELFRSNGVSDDRLRSVERATKKDLTKFYQVGEAKFIPGQEGIKVQQFAGEGEHGVYIEIDGSDNPESARYYIGLKGLLSGKSYSYEEIVACLN